MRQKGFHRHYPTAGWPLYWLLVAYIVTGWFWPVVGWALLFYIIGTVATAFRRGRWWCGHVCPRGNMFLRLLSRYSPHRQIPPFVRTFGFRLLVVMVVFTSFGIGIYNTWGCATNIMQCLTVQSRISTWSLPGCRAVRTCHSPFRLGYRPPICRRCASAAWR